MPTAAGRDALVERVARAIAAARWAGSSAPLWDKLADEDQEDHRRMARAAIEAMREPPAAA